MTSTHALTSWAAYCEIRSTYSPYARYTTLRFWPSTKPRRRSSSKKRCSQVPPVAEVANSRGYKSTFVAAPWQRAAMRHSRQGRRLTCGASSFPMPRGRACKPYHCFAGCRVFRKVAFIKLSQSGELVRFVLGKGVCCDQTHLLPEATRLTSCRQRFRPFFTWRSAPALKAGLFKEAVSCGPFAAQNCKSITWPVPRQSYWPARRLTRGLCDTLLFCTDFLL